jgi:enterochelin esterase family protein
MRATAIVAALLVACGSSSSTTPSDKSAAPSAHGTVSTRTFHSKALGVDKDYLVYLPAGYDAKPDMRWPVFYYLHGLTGNETNWIKHGKLDETADKMSLAAIVVMPDGDDGFYADSVAPAPDYDACMKDGSGLFAPVDAKWFAKTCVRKRAYETYVIEDLIADVDAHYRTIASRDGRAIAGLSMGGFGALELAMRHRDLFVASASHSGVDALLAPGETDVSHWGEAVGAIGPWVRGIFGTDIANWRAHDPTVLAASLHDGDLALYLDCGTEDDFHLDVAARYLHQVLEAHKIAHVYFTGPGKHDFTFWSQRLPESLAFLREHATKPRVGPADARQPAAKRPVGDFGVPDEKPPVPREGHLRQECIDNPLAKDCP